MVGKAGKPGEISLGICSLSAPGQSVYFFSSFSSCPRYIPISLILRGVFHTPETVN